MSEVWLTHPNLTPAHDFKGSIGAWIGSGWQVREDQSDPPPELAPADTEPVASDVAPEPVSDKPDVAPVVVPDDGADDAPAVVADEPAPAPDEFPTDEPAGPVTTRKKG